MEMEQRIIFIVIFTTVYLVGFIAGALIWGRK
jgi:uncharacterized membrane protein